MMTTRLLSTIAVVALLGASATAAQGVSGQVNPEPPPAALKNAPAEKVAPPMNAGEQVPIGTTGEGSPQALEPGNGANTGLKADGAAGAAPQIDGTGKRETTGLGAAAGAARLTTEQRTMITRAIREQKPESLSLNFDVEVGTQIPGRVQFHALPGSVVEIQPQWRGYSYILVGDRIVIIEPDKRTVVFIIEA